MTFTHALSTDNYGCAKFIVSANVYEGTHTTIAAALTSASSGDTIFVRPGTYTENLTLKAGVDIVAFSADGQTPNVIISGKATASTAGTFGFSGIRLQTNSDFFLVNSGSGATIVNMLNCYLNCLNNTGISFTNSNAASQINVMQCNGDLATTGIALFASSSAGSLTFENCIFSNSGGSSTASTASAGTLTAEFTKFLNPVTTSGTNLIALNYSDINTLAQNVIALTVGGSGANNRIGPGILLSGSAACVSIGSTLTMAQCEVNSTNANPVTGAGTLSYTPFSFTGTGKGVNVTTRTPLNYGTWTPTMVGGSTAGTTTYTTQQGYYTIVGNLVLLEALIVITAATGTGNATFGNFPFTVKNLTNYSPVGNFVIASTGWSWDGGGTMLAIQPVANTITANVSSNKSLAAANLNVQNSAATFAFSCWYQI